MPGVDLKKAKAKLQQARKDAADREAMKNGYKFKEGENRLRILPPWDDSGEWHVEAYFHYELGKEPIWCPKENRNQPCPICEMADDMRASGDKEGAYKYRASLRCFANVLDLDQKEADEKLKVRVMSFPMGLRDSILPLFDADGEFGVGDFTDPKTGRNLKITTEGQKKARKYKNVEAGNKPVEIPNWEDKVKPNLKNLTAELKGKEKTYQDIEAILDGVSEGEETPEVASSPAGDDDGFGGGSAKKAEEPKKESQSVPPAGDLQSKMKERLAKLKSQK